MIDFSQFEIATGFVFTNKMLLEQAFTHRSFMNEQTGTAIGHNERLEFLGDAVLELITTDYLYKKYPEEDEGELTAYRSALVNATIIAEVAGALNMNEYLRLSKGEAKDTGKARTYILANTYEAYLGALYLDQGYDACKKFVEQSLFPRLAEIVEKKLWRDPKSLVQERAQEHLSLTPSYRVISEVGPDHDKQFTIGIFFGNEQAATGRGKSKQEGEQAAAHAALAINKWFD
jgi:ribonuclease III